MYGMERIKPQKAVDENLEQYSQRIVREGLVKPGVGATKPYQAKPKEPTAADAARGALAVGASKIAMPAAAVVDSTRSGLVRAFGGDPSTLSGGEYKYGAAALRLNEMGNKKIDAYSDHVSDKVSSAALNALGAKPLPAAQPAAVDSPSAPGKAQQAQEAATANQASQEPAGNGYTQTAGGTAARRGPNGRLEFTNDPALVAGAGLGAIKGAKLNDDKGSFSVAGQAGDAQRAIATYDRANAIREETIKVARRGEPNGGLTIIPDSTKGMGLDRVMNERKADQRYQQQLADKRTDRLGNLKEQEARLGLERGQQELAQGRLSMEYQQQLEDIKAKLADPKLPADQRAVLEQTYYAITTPAKDRYMTVEGGTGQFGEKQASRVLDRRTGQYIDGPAASSAQSTEKKGVIGSVYPDGNGNFARLTGYDEQGNAQWEVL